MILCYNDEARQIKLEQSEEAPQRLFRMTYGKMVLKNLTYDQATKALGQAILHALCCEGKATSEGA
jgi:hypothetical protein